MKTIKNFMKKHWKKFTIGTVLGLIVFGVSKTCKSKGKEES